MGVAADPYRRLVSHNCCFERHCKDGVPCRDMAPRTHLTDIQYSVRRNSRLRCWMVHGCRSKIVDMHEYLVHASRMISVGCKSLHLRQKLTTTPRPFGVTSIEKGDSCQDG